MQCPYCKEEIIDGALKCKHCGSSLNLPPTPPGAQPADIGTMFNNALTLWKENLADLVILTLVLLLVGWVPIVNIAFFAGYTRSLLKVARGQGKAKVGDLFNAWDCFANLLIYCLILFVCIFVLHFIPFMGTLGAIALGFFAVPGFYLIIDKGKGIAEAFNWCVSTIQADFVNWLLAYLVGNVICCAGAIVFFIGIILTAPLGQLIVIQQYEQAKPSPGL